LETENHCRNNDKTYRKKGKDFPGKDIYLCCVENVFEELWAGVPAKVIITL